jgi:hypothetical protein
MVRKTLHDLIRAYESGMLFVSDVSYVPQFLRNDADRLGRLLDRSYQKLSVIYAFLEIVGDDSNLAMSVSMTDLNRQPDGTPLLERYVLDASECLAVASLGVDAVSLIEMSDMTLAITQPVEKPPYATALLGQRAFVHIDRNCIELLESVLEGGRSAEWASFRIGYSQGPIQQRSGINMCLYWFEGSSVPHFHLATSEGVDAVKSYTDLHIADSQRLRQISSGPGFDRIDSRLLSKLIDHPLFNYYLAGRSPKDSSSGPVIT